MSDEIDNIKMRARRTPPSMLELSEYYKKKTGFDVWLQRTFRC